MWHAGEANAPTPLSGASARVRIGRADEKLSHQKSAANPAFAFTPGGSRLPPGYFELSKIIRLFAGQLTLIRPLRTRTLAGGQVYLILRCCALRIPAQMVIIAEPCPVLVAARRVAILRSCQQPIMASRLSDHVWTIEQLIERAWNASLQSSSASVLKRAFSSSLSSPSFSQGLASFSARPYGQSGRHVLSVCCEMRVDFTKR